MGKDLDEQLEILNALFPIDQEWRWTYAKKDHVDEFGNPIKEGEYYIKRQTGVAEDFKLSQDSMEKLYNCLFLKNNELLKNCKEANEQFKWELKKEHLRCSPVRNLRESRKKGSKGKGKGEK